MVIEAEPLNMIGQVQGLCFIDPCDGKVQVNHSTGIHPHSTNINPYISLILILILIHILKMQLTLAPISSNISTFSNIYPSSSFD